MDAFKLLATERLFSFFVYKHDKDVDMTCRRGIVFALYNMFYNVIHN